MKTLDLSNIIASTRRLGAVRATYDHIIEALIENTDMICRSICNNNQTNVMLLYGCVNSGSGLNYIISAGAVYYQGEVYLVPAFTGTATGVQVPSVSILTAWRAGDPVKYSDNNTFNTHKIRTMVWTIGASGAGLSDFGSIKSTQKANTVKPAWINLTLLNGFTGGVAKYRITDQNILEIVVSLIAPAVPTATQFAIISGALGIPATNSVIASCAHIGSGTRTGAEIFMISDGSNIGFSVQKMGGTNLATWVPASTAFFIQAHLNIDMNY